MCAQTPTRRSKRFQPIVSAAGPSNSRKEYHWDAFILSRPATGEDFLDPDDLKEGAQCIFYNGFTRPSSQTGGAKGKKPDSDVGTDAFKIGDTVFIFNDEKLPNVAVIISMWEGSNVEEEDTTMNAKVQWFLRPKQLASVRARKEYFPVRVHSPT